MTGYFADTHYYLALVSRDDVDHGRAPELSRRLPGRMVTTAWVITELADAFSASAQRGAFLDLLRRLRANPILTIVPPTQELFDRAIELYAARQDKDWSLTDCISFVVMRDQGIREALTGDHHFEQAGFRILLK